MIGEYRFKFDRWKERPRVRKKKETRDMRMDKELQISQLRDLSGGVPHMYLADILNETKPVPPI